MMPLRPSKSALRAFHLQKQLAGRRPFSTSFVASAASPHRSSVQKRTQSTATASNPLVLFPPMIAVQLKPGSNLFNRQGVQTRAQSGIQPGAPSQ